MSFLHSRATATIDFQSRIYSIPGLGEQPIELTYSKLRIQRASPKKRFIGFYQHYPEYQILTLYQLQKISKCNNLFLLLDFPKLTPICFES